MFSSGDLTVITPATHLAALEAAGNRPRMRRIMLEQRRMSESCEIRDAAGVLLAVAFLWHRGRYMELALGLLPAARARMIPLVRLAHRTLAAISETGVIVFARIHRANDAGKRMARAAGFKRPTARTDAWFWRG